MATDVLLDVLAFLHLEMIINKSDGLNTASRELSTLIAKYHPALKLLFSKGARAIGKTLEIVDSMRDDCLPCSHRVWICYDCRRERTECLPLLPIYKRCWHLWVCEESGPLLHDRHRSPYCRHILNDNCDRWHLWVCDESGSRLHRLPLPLLPFTKDIRGLGNLCLTNHLTVLNYPKAEFFIEEIVQNFSEINIY